MIEEAFEQDQHRIEENDRAYQDWYDMGFDDAIHPNHQAKYNNDAYLAGLVAGLKSLPETPAGTIAYPPAVSTTPYPRPAFAFGWVDLPHGDF
jgi:hypothetical protein